MSQINARVSTDPTDDLALGHVPRSVHLGCPLAVLLSPLMIVLVPLYVHRARGVRCRPAIDRSQSSHVAHVRTFVANIADIRQTGTVCVHDERRAETEEEGAMPPCTYRYMVRGRSRGTYARVRTYTGDCCIQ
jgi:hypothetical protein